MSSNIISITASNSNDEIALEIFNRLKAIEPCLEAKGMIAGQSVATIYQEIIGSKLKGLVNDIDQFFFVSGSSKLYVDYCNDSETVFKKNATEMPDILPIGLEIEKDHSYGNVVYIDRDKGGYNIFLTARKGLVNIVVGKVENDVKFTKNPMNELELLVSGFDLNAVMAGICFDSKGAPKLFLHPDYLRFLETGEILITNFFSYAHSVVRGYKKTAQIENSYFNAKGYVNSLKDKAFIEGFGSSQIVDSYTANHYLSDFNYLELYDISDLITKSGCEQKKEDLSLKRKRDLQVNFGVSYGFKKKHIRFIDFCLEQRRFLSGVTVDDVFSNKDSFKSILSMMKFISKHYILNSASLDFRAIKTLNLFKKDESVIGFIESIYSIAKQNRDYASVERLERALTTENKEFVVDTIKDINNDFNKRFSDQKKSLDAIRALIPKSILGYKIEMPTTALELSNLGKSENHCVGGYYAKVMTGMSLIFTISKPGTVKSTFELGESHASDGWVVKQQYSKNNKKEYSKIHRYIGLMVALLVSAKKGVLKGFFLHLKNVYLFRFNMMINDRKIRAFNTSLLKDENVPF